MSHLVFDSVCSLKFFIVIVLSQLRKANFRMANLQEKKMPTWSTRPVTEQGALTLSEWRVVELHDGERHLVGYCLENNEGRVSSPVLNLEQKTLRVTTSTGRLYLLSGAPGLNSDAMYVWDQWIKMYSIESWSDVTDSVWNQHLVLRPNT